MMKKKLLPVLVWLTAGLMLSACQKNEEGVGPAEQAGRKLDQVTEKTGRELAKAAEQAGEKMSEAAREAKMKIDEASDTAGEKMEQAGQKLKDGDDKSEEDKAK